MNKMNDIDKNATESFFWKLLLIIGSPIFLTAIFSIPSFDNKGLFFIILFVLWGVLWFVSGVLFFFSGIMSKVKIKTIIRLIKIIIGLILAITGIIILKSSFFALPFLGL